jgi:hypothetical protein
MGLPSSHSILRCGVNYEFLLGKLLRLDSQRFVVSALTERNGVTMARLLARIEGQRATLSLPARIVVQHLVCDQSCGGNERLQRSA